MISVIIPTRNRAELLSESIKLLFAQDFPKDQYEIVVVDDASADNTFEVTQRLAAEGLCTLRCFRNEVNNLAHARNLAIREARGDIVLIMNDDVRAEPFLVAEHARFHAEHPEPSAAVLSRVDQIHGPNPTPFHLFNNPFPFQEIAGRVELDYLYFWTNSISLKRTFLLGNGLFDEDFVGAGHEDIELGYRLAQRGLRLFYNERLTGHHFHPQTFDDACRQQYRRGEIFAIAEPKVPDRAFRERNSIFSWNNSPRKIARELVRRLLFNGLTIPFWRAYLVGRTRNSWLTNNLYWKVLTHYTNAGYRAAKRSMATK